MIADAMLNKKLVKHVYILTPGSLRMTWVSEYCNVCGKDPLSLSKDYTFITYNYSVGKKFPNVEGCLVIIDEVHNLINGVKNGSSNPTKIYDGLAKSNCRILALSGTPIFNSVGDEWPFIGQLLKPGDDFPNIREDMKKGQLDTFSFLKHFIIKDDGSLVPKNSSMKSRLKGIVSFFPGIGEKFVPKVIHMEPIKVEMSPLQEANYWKLFLQEEKFKIKPEYDRLKDKKMYKFLLQMYIMAKKKILSRSASNFFYPPVFKQMRDIQGKAVSKNPFEIEDTDGGVVASSNKKVEIGNTKELEKFKFFIQLDEEDAKEMCSEDEKMCMKGKGWVNKAYFSECQLGKIYSTKFTAFFINLLAHSTHKHVLFTFFKNKAGVILIKSLLDMCGISSGIFSGDLNDKKRRELLKVFNSKKNKHGNIMRVLLVTEAGAEGISVLEARHFHILESSPRISKTIQAIGRVARYKSHMRLPEAERNVKVWRYWSMASKEPITVRTEIIADDGSVSVIDKLITDKKTVDEILYNDGMKQLKEIESFHELLKTVSVV